MPFTYPAALLIVLPASRTACLTASAVPPRPLLLSCRYDQPYQVALYSFGVLAEARRWHVTDYEAVLPGVMPEALQVGGQA